MSFNSLAGWNVAALRRYLPATPSAVDFGNQSFMVRNRIIDRCTERLRVDGISVDTAFIKRVKALHHRARHPMVADFFHAIGFSQYVAIDVNSLYGSLIMDLNKDLRSEYGYSQQFDLTINSGTGEHIFNQFAVFKNAHDLTKPGGIIFNMLPVNWVNHGFYNFSPALFIDTAAANGYEILKLGFGISRGFEVAYNASADAAAPRSNLELLLASVAFGSTRPLAMLDFRKKPWERPLASAIRAISGQVFGHQKRSRLFNIVVFRKRNDREFAIPIQGIYANVIESDEIKARYSAPG